MSEAAAAAAPAPSAGPKLTLHKMYPVGFYTLENAGTQCSICKVTFEDVCPQCRADGGSIEECISTKNSTCGHQFHTHCIHGWLKKSSKCPVCDNEWNGDA